MFIHPPERGEKVLAASDYQRRRIKRIIKKQYRFVANAGAHIHSHSASCGRVNLSAASAHPQGAARAV